MLSNDQNRRLIPAPGFDVLSDDYHQPMPETVDPTLYVNSELTEPIPYNEVYRKRRQSEFNTRPSRYWTTWTLYWQRFWQSEHGSLRIFQPEPLAKMSTGTQLPVVPHGLIRQPKPAGYGDLQVSAGASAGFVDYGGSE